jgi:hypothetical protein
MSKRILVVDDEPDVNITLRKVLVTGTQADVGVALN